MSHSHFESQYAFPFTEILVQISRCSEFCANSALECFISSTPHSFQVVSKQTHCVSFKLTRVLSEWNPFHKMSLQISQHASEGANMVQNARSCDEEKLFALRLQDSNRERARAIRKCARNCPHYQDESEFHANATRDPPSRMHLIKP
jgi:hypothetical protein